MKVAPLTEKKNTNTSAEQDLTVNTASGWFLWLIVIGFMLFIFAFFTNNWHVEPTKWSGLWMVCGISSGFVGEGVMEATHACMVVAIVFYCTSYLMLILYLFSEPQCVGPKFILVLFFISSLLTTIFIVTALVIFGVAVKQNLAFSFFLEGVSAFLSLGTSILAIVQVAQEG